MKPLSNRKFSLGILLASQLICFFATSIQAQDTSLVDLQRQFTEIQTKLEAKEKELESGTDVRQRRTEFKALVEQANQLVSQMKDQCLEQLKKNPKDPQTTRLIMGILLNQANEEKDREVLRTGEQLIRMGIKPVYFEVASKAERLTIKAREMFEELLIRQREAEKNDLPQVKLTTNRGDIVVELYEDQAPNTVNNFISLVEARHYTDIQFHRVIDGFMAQAGQNKTDGKEVPELGYTIACECDSPETRRHFTDCISMALKSVNPKDSGSNQFFLTLSRTSHLDGAHTCFGRVIEGFEVLDKIERTSNAGEEAIPNVVPDRILSAEVVRKREHEYKPRKLGEPDPKAKPKAEPPQAPEKAPVKNEEEMSLPDLPDRESEADKSEADKSEADKSEADKSEADKSEADKSEADKSEADKSEADKSEADKSEADKSETDEGKDG